MSKSMWNTNRALNLTVCGMLPLALTLASATAGAQTPEATPAEAADTTTTTDAEKRDVPDGVAPNDGDLPVAKSDDDPAPEVASPGAPAGGLVKQAGVGGTTGYGRAGVLELGGSVNGRFASNFSSVGVSPSIGWFVADNLQLSGIVDLAYAKTGDNDATSFSALVEPSYHLPFNRSVFGFVGMGMGASYVEGLGTGFAIAPRLGMNVMVGRSGILSPFISFQYTTHDTEGSGTVEDPALVAVSRQVRFNVGYTVMW